MSKEPKANWSSFSKAELILTIKKLDARQTKLLNQIAKLEASLVKFPPSLVADFAPEQSKLFPWETK